MMGVLRPLRSVTIVMSGLLSTRNFFDLLWEISVGIPPLDVSPNGGLDKEVVFIRNGAGEAKPLGDLLQHRVVPAQGSASLEEVARVKHMHQVLLVSVARVSVVVVLTAFVSRGIVLAQRARGIRLLSLGLVPISEVAEGRGLAAHHLQRQWEVRVLDFPKEPSEVIEVCLIIWRRIEAPPRPFDLSDSRSLIRIGGSACCFAKVLLRRKGCFIPQRLQQRPVMPAVSRLNVRWPFSTSFRCLLVAL